MVSIRPGNGAAGQRAPTLVLTDLGQALVARAGVASADLPPVPDVALPCDLPTWAFGSTLALRQLQHRLPEGVHVTGLPRVLHRATVEELFDELSDRSATFRDLPRSFGLWHVLRGRAILEHGAFVNSAVPRAILDEIDAGSGASGAAFLQSSFGDLRLRLAEPPRAGVGQRCTPCGP